MKLSVDSLTILLVSGLQFRTAARFADQHMLDLRAGDALHLAICADHGATLCTLDRRLSEAGPALGVKTMLLWRASAGFFLARHMVTMLDHSAALALLA